MNPDLIRASNAAYALHADRAAQAGRHLAAASVHLRADLADAHRRSAGNDAAEAGAALLEARDLHRLAQEAGR